MGKLSTGGTPQHPDWKGVAVCVDVTDPEVFIDKATGQPSLDERGNPQKPKFKYVFETALISPDGRPYTIESQPFSESYHEKSPHRPFLVGWQGRTMTAQELTEFDTKGMVGKCAYVIIKNEPSAKDKAKSYAQIKFIEPTKEELKPSGLYVRRAKRAVNDAQRNNTGAHAGAAEDWESTKIHLKSSEFCGSEIREVSEGHVIKLIDKWLPVFKSAAKTTADDKRLAFALEQWQARKANEPDDTGESVEESDLDEVPL
jgi:hypothetical protein